MNSNDFSIIEKRKIKLISIISRLYDSSTLEEIENILIRKNSDWWDEISEYEKEAIKDGLKDIEDGKLISHDQVMNNISDKFGV